MRGALKRSSAYKLHVAEPKSAYQHRPPLVTDASVIAAALFGAARSYLANDREAHEAER